MYTMEDTMEEDCYANVLLQCGIEAGDKQLINKALDVDANVNLAVIAEGKNYGFTPLMFALRKGDFDTAAKLVQEGALVGYRYKDLNGNQKSVASLAYDFDNPHILSFLKRCRKRNIVEILHTREMGEHIDPEEIVRCVKVIKEKRRKGNLLWAPRKRKLQRTRANLHEVAPADLSDLNFPDL